MGKLKNVAIGDLLTGALAPQHAMERLGPGATLLRNFVGDAASALVATISAIAEAAPFRHMVTPGGYRMSVAMTNCGPAGWVTDRRGYRYDAVDPETGCKWPALPSAFQVLATDAAAAAGFAGFTPDACLINRYEPGAKLSLHQDKDERDFTQPIVSVSLGLPAVFLFGGLKRNMRPRRVRLESGDIVVWGGTSRLVFHGIDTLSDGGHPLTGRRRYNLTFRKAL
jgi:alkylated DNA repair protein (DNA oxidative demethylase)